MHLGSITVPLLSHLPLIPMPLGLGDKQADKALKWGQNPRGPKPDQVGSQVETTRLDMKGDLEHREVSKTFITHWPPKCTGVCIQPGESQSSGEKGTVFTIFSSGKLRFKLNPTICSKH